ncbi:MAG: hypothetical protein P9L99_04500 [Candidatus Lernaella stagnicola]|nr:hypothetical protein [Candidatus Lernaella stagnicola]
MRSWLQDALFGFLVATGIFAVLLALLAWGQGGASVIYRGF